MKKLMLAKFVYRSGYATDLITNHNLVLINSSTTATDAEDHKAAVDAARAYFNANNKTGWLSLQELTVQNTIIADNPEPPALYTEEELVSFGNYMASKICNLQPEQSPVVFDSDLANWRETRDAKRAQ